MHGPKINGNPLKISAILLVISYILGEFIFPKYPLYYIINLIGILGLIISLGLFIAGFNLFKSYAEDPNPTSSSKNLIKTGIFTYTRNPIYLSFVIFFISMFLIFENIFYLLSVFGLSIWLHHWVIALEEEYLLNKFSDEFKRYKAAVNRWLFF